jgi:hypothetical protein
VFFGRVPVRNALIHSLNVATVKVAEMRSTPGWWLAHQSESRAASTPYFSRRTTKISHAPVEVELKLAAMGRMTPRPPVGSAMPMKVASPRVMPLGPFVSDWTRQVGLGKATSVKGAFCGRTRGRFG